MHGIRFLEKHQQRAAAMLNKGQYTLYPCTADSLTVLWPTTVAADKYRPRVERCLNIALRDQSKESVVSYLHGLVRMALRLSEGWSPIVAEALGKQFSLEFGWDARRADDADPCECVWAGDRADDRRCDAGCKATYMKVGPVVKGGGVQSLVEKMEAEDWMLRIWARKSGVVGWRRRLVGEGFPGVREGLDDLRPVLGRGWQGLGAVEFGGVGQWEEWY